MKQTFYPTREQILHGHNDQATAHIIENYPYGRLRTKMLVWIERDEKKGCRYVTQTVNPKNGQLNKPHKGVYAPFIVMYRETETGHIKPFHFYLNDSDTNTEELNWIIEAIGAENLTAFQQERIKNHYYYCHEMNYRYNNDNRSAEAQAIYKNWITQELAIHVNVSKFEDLTKHSPAPTFTPLQPITV